MIDFDKVNYIKADEGNITQRIDNFLINLLKGVPKSHIYQLLRKGEVRVNKKKIKPLYKLQAGDDIRIAPIKNINNNQSINKIKRLDKANFSWLENAFLFEDESIIAIDKPAGLSVHEISNSSLGLIEIIKILRPECLKLELIHRIDKKTSGVILVAKNLKALRNIQDQFRANKVDKFYEAIVLEKWDKNIKIIDKPLEILTNNAQATKKVQIAKNFNPANPKHKTAITLIEKVRFLKINNYFYTRLRIKLLTGRTHQIRIHLASFNHAIINDDKYGAQAKNNVLKQKIFLASEKNINQHLKTNQMLLNANEIIIRHPISNEKITFKSKQSFDIDAFLIKKS